MCGVNCHIYLAISTTQRYIGVKAKKLSNAIALLQTSQRLKLQSPQQTYRSQALQLTILVYGHGLTTCCQGLLGQHTLQRLARA